MTARERVGRTRAALTAGAVARSLAWGIAATLGALAMLSFGSLLVPALGERTVWPTYLALLGGLAVAGVFVWRSRHLISTGRVALWIEERIPGLQYSLITAVEHDASPFTAGMEATVARHDIGGVTRKALTRSLIPAFSAAGIAAALLYVSPSAAFGGDQILPTLGGSGGRGVDSRPGGRLEELSVRITPPSYSRQRATELDDPSSVSALVGSSVTVSGPGSPRGLTVSVGNAERGVTSGGRGWTVSIVMPARPAALALRDRGIERIIVLDPRADNPPRVVLRSPARDTTLRAARLVIRLDATATDDVGLQAGYFEYLVTTGSGEVFSARTVTTPPVRFDGSRSGQLSATLDLASLKVGQGDVVSIRAIVQDVNTLSGPSLATSDTRTYRIARADEYDSVAVDAAGPLPVDSSAMSQRMLIMMTEQLVREQPRLTRDELVRRSSEIGDLEDRIRKRVEEILYPKDEEGEGAEDAEASTAGPEAHAHSEEEGGGRNPDLLEAFNALWEAVRSLQIAEPAPALPPMRVALKALDRARLANRLYLRGIPPKVVVDLARVRMTGKEKGSASTRTPILPADSARARLGNRFSDAIELIEEKPAEAIRAFTLLQVDALSSSPAFAGALGEAIDAFRKGRDATIPLLRARRALSGEPAAAPGLSPWSGGW